jgi:molybdopterin-guanine dinucleotide biosynthesis protein
MVRRTKGQHATLDEVRPLIPAETDILLCEGFILAGKDVRTVVCTKSETEAVAMLAELPEDAHVIAVSGVVSRKRDHIAGLPALDSAEDVSLKSLATLITK